MDILFIDDEARRMRTTVEMLRADNYSVELVNSPTQALKMLQENPHLCKLIILDIMMPVNGGFDTSQNEYGLHTGILLLEKLREDGSFNIPVIVLTANRAVENKLKDKVHRFLHKPINYAMLKSSIQDCIRQN